ncbi:hypothetical protein [Sinorhizobium meliloti]|uniref:hypothetical protein n=1 Tax=Rhizobium meliloti TaxID=382 RepID=UPI0013E3F48A|nr:hypothetical protein [Sinorhizobium meliloti]
MARPANDNLPRSRKDAIAVGVTRYFTGKPCKHGHVAARAVSNSGCVVCSLNHKAKWLSENPEKMQECRESWAAANPERDKEVKRSYASKFYWENHDLALERGRKSREKNRDENNRRRRERRAADKEMARKIDREWRLSNPDKVKATQQKSYKKRREDPAVRLNASMAAGIRHSLRNGSKGGRRWETLAGYTVIDLIRHLERQFLPGMSWENYGEWEIDHKIPLSAHNFETPEDPDFSRAWALSNLQPLWKIENITKSNRLAAPFQPSLMLRPANDNEPGAANA